MSRLKLLPLISWPVRPGIRARVRVQVNDDSRSRSILIPPAVWESFNVERLEIGESEVLGWWARERLGADGELLGYEIALPGDLMAGDYLTIEVHNKTQALVAFEAAAVHEILELLPQSQAARGNGEAIVGLLASVARDASAPEADAARLALGSQDAARDADPLLLAATKRETEEP